MDIISMKRSTLMLMERSMGAASCMMRFIYVAILCRPSCTIYSLKREQNRCLGPTSTLFGSMALLSTLKAMNCTGTEGKTTMTSTKELERTAEQWHAHAGSIDEKTSS